MRFSFIDRVRPHRRQKPHESREHVRSQKIDRIPTRFTAIPALVAIMALVFWLTFNVIGAVAGAADAGIGWLTDFRWRMPGRLRSTR